MALVQPLDIWEIFVQRLSGYGVGDLSIFFAMVFLAGAFLAAKFKMPVLAFFAMFSVLALGISRAISPDLAGSFMLFVGLGVTMMILILVLQIKNILN